MKRLIKKWGFRLSVTGFFIVGLLLVIVLNPMLTYAHKTVHTQYAIYHHKSLEPTVTAKLDKATQLLKASELYNPKLKLDICLNDGSDYPKLIQTLRGQAFAWGFYDKVVLQGVAHWKENYVELNGYRWNLTQLLAHEMVHCFQFDHLGLWKSKPLANIPNWKWEGYAEYISRQNNDQKDLLKNIERSLSAKKDKWEIRFADSTIAPSAYYDYWILVQYCMDIRKMTYQQMLLDTTNEQVVREEMMNWLKRR